MILYKIKKLIFTRIIIRLFNDVYNDLVEDIVADYIDHINRLEDDLKEAYEKIDYLEERVYMLEL